MLAGLCTMVLLGHNMEANPEAYAIGPGQCLDGMWCLTCIVTKGTAFIRGVAEPTLQSADTTQPIIPTT